MTKKLILNRSTNLINSLKVKNKYYNLNTFCILKS